MQMESSTASLTFKGSIPEAIVEAKNKRKLFLVYISGKLDSYNPLLIVCFGFLGKQCGLLAAILYSIYFILEPS